MKLTCKGAELGEHLASMSGLVSSVVGAGVGGASGAAVGATIDAINHFNDAIASDDVCPPRGSSPSDFHSIYHNPYRSVE